MKTKKVKIESAVVAKRIVELRTAIGLGAADFGAKTPGLSTSNLQKIESGAKSVSMKVIDGICEYWEVPKAWLLSGEDAMRFNKGKINGTSADLYKDALYTELKESNKELKEDKNYWKEKYDQVFTMLAQVMPLGKLKSLVPAGFFKNKESRTGARV